MGKDVKMKHSASSPPPKNWWKKSFFSFFAKELCMGGQSFLASLWGDVLHGDWWSDHARRKLMVKSFQSLGQFSFPLIVPDLGYWHIIWKVNTTNRKWIWKTPYAHYASGFRISCKACLLF